MRLRKRSRREKRPLDAGDADWEAVEEEEEGDRGSVQFSGTSSSFGGLPRPTVYRMRRKMSRRRRTPAMAVSVLQKSSNRPASDS